MDHQLQQIFTGIYQNNLWSMGQNDSKSGLGSSDDFTKHIQQYLIETVNRHQIKNMIDTSCGDLRWMKWVLPFLNCDYLGLDIVENIVVENEKQCNNIKNNHNIAFKHASFLEYLESLPNKSVDLILCRHTCEHLPTEYVLRFIEQAKRVSKYLLLTTHRLATENREVVLTETPYRPINLSLPPYSNVLQSYLIEETYDGPSSHNRPEMFIHLYHFA